MQMNKNKSFTTNSLIDALSRIYSEKLSGVLSLPYRDIIARFFFKSSLLAALDIQMGKKYLIPFIESKGADISAICIEEASLVKFINTNQAVKSIVEFFALLFEETSSPSMSVLINFDEKQDLAEIEDTQGLATSNIVLTFYEKWIKPETLSKLAPSMDEIIKARPDSMSRARNLPLTPQQAFVLTRLMDGLKVHDLVLSCGLGEDVVLRALLAFNALGIVRCGKEAKPIPDQKEQFHKEELFLEDIENIQPQQAHPAEEKPPSTEKPTKVPPEILAEIEDYEIIAEKGDYYQLLDLMPRTEASEIKEQFSALVKKFHPDKFHQFYDQDLQNRVNKLFEKITEAYEILKDPERRKKYDSQIGLSGPYEDESKRNKPEKQGSGKYAYEDTEHRAKQHFLHGKEAFKRKQFHDAVEHFREAVRLHPEVAEYQFMLGKTLS